VAVTGKLMDHQIWLYGIQQLVAARVGVGKMLIESGYVMV
jgi:hypothetical protein